MDSTAAYAPNPGPPIPASRRRIRGVPRSSFRWQMGLIFLLLCFWERVPFALVGVYNQVGYQAYGAVVFLGVLIFFYKAASSRLRVTVWDFMALFLFSWCFLVSFIYSNFTAPQSLIAWLPTIYIVSPVLLVLLLKGGGARYEDAEKALYLTGFLGSLLVLVNNVGNLHFLDAFIRGSGFGTENRVVFFKLEATFALMIALVRLIYARRFTQIIGAMIVIAVTFYNVFVLSESRLAMAAVLIALFLTWLFVMRGGRKLFFIFAGPLIAFPVIGYVIDRYLRSATDFQKYLLTDMSARFRQLEMEHFGRYFEETSGLGFGFMSGNPEFDNILSFSTNKAGYIYGSGSYGMGVDDIGIYSALYQFGWLGLVLVLAMTAMASIALIRAGRREREYVAAGAVGALMIAFMLSPISMNFFTLVYTGHIGGLIWFMAANVSKRGLPKKAAQPSGENA